MIKKLSIIVPAYNEEKRIDSFLFDLNKYCIKNLKNYEILVIDDGSKDNTVNILKKSNYKNLKYISYKPNKGKAHAVKTGVAAAESSHLLFIDADGATAPEEISKMLPRFEKYNIVVGSRNLKQSKAKKRFTRRILSFGFNSYISLLFGMSFSDYLCGFKGFKTSIAKRLFYNLESERWIFDVELFYKIKKNKLSIIEIPIQWTHQDDSKMKIIDVIKIFFQILLLRLKIY